MASTVEIFLSGPNFSNTKWTPLRWTAQALHRRLLGELDDCAVMVSTTRLYAAIRVLTTKIFMCIPENIKSLNCEVFT